MLRIASTTLFASLLATASLATGCVIEDGSGGGDSSSTLTVTNSSDFNINELYLTFSGVSDWGPNRLGNAPLLPGDAILLDGISCDTYDALLVDETNAQCEVDAISLCFDDADWVLRNNTCNVFKAVEGSPQSQPRVFPTQSKLPKS